jgi:hypothetical protein
LFGSDQDAGGAGAVDAVTSVPLRARGRLRAGEFILAPLRIEQLDADVELAGKTIEVHHAKGSFGGGSIEGQLTAALGSAPTYDASLRFDRVDFATVAQDVPSLQGKLDGAAAGELALHAAGIGRDALLDSLTGQGSIAARNLQIRGFNLAALRADQSAIDDEHFAAAQAEFRIEDRSVHATAVRLIRPGENLLAAGSVDFQGTLDFRIDVSTGAEAASVRVAGPAFLADPEASSGAAYRLTGSLASPQLAPFQASVAAQTSANRARGGRRRAQP